ncbi:MAG: hypothetical protein HYZ89_05270 [Candidatus Omnitrophica bacterium]|nr:hypothetical protein [Candidatus Omnitrophota bacterium]
MALFAWVRLRTVLAAWSRLSRSPFKFTVIVVAWGSLVTGAYLLTHRGLEIVYTTAGLGVFLLDRLMALLICVIWLMLIVSQWATAYATLIRSPETAYWMSLPVSARWIMRAKWIESSCYSAWAIFLLILPMGVAYLQVLHASVWMTGWLIVLWVPLVGMATALSTLVLLVWLRWMKGAVIRRELIPIGLVLVGVALFWLLGQRDTMPSHDLWFAALQDVLPRMRLATSLWMPSSWTARAFGACVNHRWVEASLFGALLWSTFLVSARALDHAAVRILLPVLRDSAAAGHRRPVVASPTATRLVGWTRRPWRACLRKDIMLLLRDPVQWSQGVVFFGLLGAYFANLHRVAWMTPDPSWRVGIASLNLASTLMVFGSLAVRFVFPQMSLEGRQLWLIRMMPGGLRRLLASKVVWYGGVGVVVIEGLLLLSSSRLALPLPIRWWLLSVGLLASVSLVGLMLGLGSWLIDPTVSDPSRYVSSSSGALALVLMLVEVGAVIWGLAVAWTGWGRHQLGGVVSAGLGLALVSGLLGGLPLWRGIRTLERLEL